MQETPKTVYWQGVREGFPFVLVAAPFATLFGLVATEAGLNVIQVMGFSIVVIAGAAQFAALSLMEENAPTIIVILTALAVNLRMAMYSAALAPHIGAAPLWQRALAGYLLVDQNYAMSEIRFQERGDWNAAQKISYYFGVVTALVPVWYGCTLLGALFGNIIPGSWGLDFAVPITFIALVAPALRTPAHIVAAVVSVIAALLLSGLPYGSGLLIAGALAMASGAEVERRMENRAGQS